jgi:hypothetical protein
MGIAPPPPALSGIEIQRPAAAGVNSRNHLMAHLINDAVMASIRATSGLSLQIGPILNGTSALVAPAIGMERLNHVHGAEG